MCEKEIFQILSELFEAEPDEYILSEDDKRLLDERDYVKNKMDQDSLQVYLDNYEKICNYGLQDILMERLKWRILHSVEEDYEGFVESPFYNKFRSHQIVEWAIHSYKLNTKNKVND